MLDVQSSPDVAAARFLFSEIEPVGSIVFNYGPEAAAHASGPEVGPPAGCKLLWRYSSHHRKRGSLSGNRRAGAFVDQHPCARPARPKLRKARCFIAARR